MAELIDVLNEDGTKTGRIATREKVHREGLWHRIAVVVVLDVNNRILLQQRSEHKQTNPGKWDVAAAGHVDAGEDASTTAKREMEEEIGLAASDLEFLLSYAKESYYEWHDESLVDRQLFDCFMLRVPEISIDDLRLQKSEVQAAKFCDVSEFKKMIAGGVMVDREPLYARIIKMLEEESYEI